jgi:hypothetical protein
MILRDNNGHCAVLKWRMDGITYYEPICPTPYINWYQENPSLRGSVLARPTGCY